MTRNAVQEAKEIYHLIKSKGIEPRKSYKVDTLAEKIGLKPETIRVYIRDMHKAGENLPVKIGRNYTFTGLWVIKLFTWVYEQQQAQ